MDSEASRVPKYKRIAQDLKDSLARGDYKAGSQLPPQDELARLHDVSLLTIRQSLGILEEDGLISRVHGHGTFVLDSKSKGSASGKQLVAFLCAGGGLVSGNSYLQLELEALDGVLSERGRRLGFSVLSQHDIAHGVLPPILRGGDVRGVILEHYVRDVHVEFLKAHGFPLLVIGSNPTSVPVANLMLNQEQAAYKMAKALLEARPGNPLCFFTEPFRLHYSFELERGYAKACREAGKEPMVRVVMDEKENPGAELRQVVCGDGRPFSLFVHANISHAIQELYRERGVSFSACPVAVYGAADYVPPPVRRRMNHFPNDIKLISSVAVELLEEAILRDECRRVFLEPEIVSRDEDGELRLDCSWRRPA